VAAVTAFAGGCSAALVCALAVSCGATVGAQRHAEYQVKAAFLLGFARFVEWPDPALAAARPSFVVCVLGDDPFGRWLDEAAAGTQTKSKPVVVRRIRLVDESGPCHMLFVGASEGTRLTTVLAAVRATPMLTVGDLPEFAEKGGMIGLTTVGDRVRFVANPAAAKAAGLQLTSELLRVAVTVLGRPDQKPPGSEGVMP
jgi:hypothetical protein